MVKPELGTKRACPSCHSRFYDLNREPIVCPICGTSFLAEALLPSKSDHPTPAAPPRPQPVEVEPADAEDVEIVSLEDVKEEGEDEAADIEDVEIEDQGDDIAEDAFLEEEEEAEGGVSGLIGGGKGEDEET